MEKGAMIAANKAYWMYALLCAALLAACGESPQPTAVVFAVAQADQALSEIRDDAARHAPEMLADVEEQMRRVKSSIALRRHKEAARDMSRLGPDLQRLITITQERKATFLAERQAAAEEWNAIADEVPRTIDTLQQRIDAASRSGKPPAGMNAAKFEAFKAQFETMKATWAEADEAVTNSKAPEAAAKATQAKAIGDELLKQLKK
ncbi:MAG: hypothetical protein HC872_04060 [Gammaproteobacteria bacterium]|nr:hypothetical protein [Gammaproteobacteria bacterium]